MTCQIKSCKKKMPHAVGSTILKYLSSPHLELIKKLTRQKKGMSACLCAEINGKDCWVTALTTVMESLLSRINFTRDTNTD